MEKTKNIPIPASSRLLRGISSSDCRMLFRELKVECWSFTKGEIVIHQGDPISHFWLIVSGQVHAYTNHDNGRRTVAMSAGQGETFGVLFAYSDLTTHPSNIVTTKDTVMLKFPVFRLSIGNAMSSYGAMNTLIANIATVISQSAMRARLRIYVIAHKSVEERVIAYLTHKAKQIGSNEFEIPLDRQELADFINAGRCSLCTVLSNLKDKGMIDFRKNRFRIIKPMSCNEF